LLAGMLWVDNIKMDLSEIGWDGMDWMEVAQDRDKWRALVNTVMNQVSHPYRNSRKIIILCIIIFTF
jgi:hypothetical protein